MRHPLSKEALLSCIVKKSKFFKNFFIDSANEMFDMYNYWPNPLHVYNKRPFKFPMWRIWPRISFLNFIDSVGTTPGWRQHEERLKRRRGIKHHDIKKSKIVYVFNERSQAFYRQMFYLNTLDIKHEDSIRTCDVGISFSTDFIIKCSNSFNNKIDCYQEYVKLHDSVSYNNDTLSLMFTKFDKNVVKEHYYDMRLSKKKRIFSKRANSLIVGRFTKSGLRERSIKFYAKAMSLIFFIYKTINIKMAAHYNMNQFYDFNLLNLIIKKYYDGTIITKYIKLFNGLKTYKNFYNIFYHRQSYLNAHNSGLVLAALNRIAPVYTFNIHRTDRMRYKRSRGKLSKWSKNWTFIQKDKRVSYGLRYLKLTWRRMKVNTYAGKYVLTMFKILQHPKQTPLYLLSDVAMNKTAKS